MRRAKARRVAGVMNKTEANYAKVLDVMGVRWVYEAVTLKLGDDCRYTPDFMVIAQDDVVEFHEVKGFWRDDAKVKLRVASERFPWFRFVAAYLEGGEWRWQAFGPEDAGA